MKLSHTICRRTLLVVGVAIAAAGAGNAIGHKPSGQREAFERRINELIRDGLSSADLATLESRGTDAADYFISALTKKDTLLDRSYAWVYPRLLSKVRARLPEPQHADTIRANAAALVGFLGPKGKFAVPYLANLLQDDSAGANAAISLGAIGPDAADAVPALMTAVEQGLPFAATALGKIGNPATAVLNAGLRNGPPWQRHECELALRRLDVQHQGKTSGQSRIESPAAGQAGAALSDAD